VDLLVDVITAEDRLSSSRLFFYYGYLSSNWISSSVYNSASLLPMPRPRQWAIYHFQPIKTCLLNLMISKYFKMCRGGILKIVVCVCG